MPESNESWLHRLRSTGDAQNEALAILRKILVSRLRSTFEGRSGVDEAFLEDVVQESLVKTLASLAQFRGKSRFATWATTIAVRVALTELRRRHWKDVSLDQFLDLGENLGAVQRATGEVTQGTLIGEMYRLIEIDLTKKQREALLAELNGMPLEEIGRRMGSNRNAIYKLTHDARKRLRAGLQAAGYTANDLQEV